MAVEKEEEGEDESNEPSLKKRKLSEGEGKKKKSKQPKEAKDTISKPVKDESVKLVNKLGSIIGRKRRERKGKKGSR